MGHSRGGLTTKIHALVDAEGRPVCLELTAGQAGDAPMATKLLDAVAPGATVIADKAHDTDGIRSFVASRSAFAWANIPPSRSASGRQGQSQHNVVSSWSFPFPPPSCQATKNHVSGNPSLGEDEVCARERPYRGSGVAAIYDEVVGILFPLFAKGRGTHRDRSS